MAADPNGAVFFPPTLLFLLRPLSAGIRASYGLWLVAFPLAAYAGLRRLKLPPAPAALAAFAAAVSGPAMTLTSFPHVAWASMLFLPIAALARGAARGRARDAVFAALLFGVAIDIGEPVIAFHLLAAAAVFSARRPIARWARDVAAIAAIGAAVALPQIAAAVQLLPRTSRGSGLDPRFASAFDSVRPLRLFGFLWPGLFGDVQSASPSGWWGARFFDAGVPYVTSLAVGTVVLVLIPVAVKDRNGRRFAVLAGLAAVASFGRYLPGGMALLSLPGFSLLRYPEKWLFVAAFSAIAAAAFALDRIAADRNAARAGIAAGGVLAALSMAVFVYCSAAPVSAAQLLRAFRVVAAPALDAAALRGIARDALQAALFAALAAAVLAAGLQGVRARRVVALLGIVWLVDLFPKTWNWVPLVPPSYFDAPPPAVAGLRGSRGRFYFDGETEVADDPLRPMRPAVWGVAFAGNNDIDRFSPRRSFLFGRAVASMPFSDPRKPALLRLADVDAFSSADPSAAAAGALEFPTSAVRKVFRLDGGARFRVFASAAAVRSEEAARSELIDPGRDLFRSLVVEGDSGEAAPSGSRAPGTESVRPIRRRADAEDVETTSASGGWLFRSETFDPHWRAEIDGRPAPVLPADFAFQAVPIAPGTHRVEFFYSDPISAAAMAVSLLALAGAALYLARSGRAVLGAVRPR